MTATLLNSYLIGTAPSLVLAYAVGRKKGVRGLTLLAGAAILAACWPLWAAGAVLLAILGTLVAIVTVTALVVVVAFCVVAFMWISLLLKCIEILGWFNSK